eukprot:417088_1
MYETVMITQYKPTLKWCCKPLYFDNIKYPILQCSTENTLVLCNNRQFCKSYSLIDTSNIWGDTDFHTCQPNRFAKCNLCHQYPLCQPKKCGCGNVVCDECVQRGPFFLTSKNVCLNCVCKECQRPFYYYPFDKESYIFHLKVCRCCGDAICKYCSTKCVRKNCCPQNIFGLKSGEYFCRECYKEYHGIIYECKKCVTEYMESDSYYNVKLCGLCGKNWICIQCNLGEMLEDNERMYCDICNYDEDTYILDSYVEEENDDYFHENGYILNDNSQLQFIEDGTANDYETDKNNMEFTEMK